MIFGDNEGAPPAAPNPAGWVLELGVGTRLASHPDLTLVTLGWASGLIVAAKKGRA